MSTKLLQIQEYIEFLDMLKKKIFDSKKYGISTMSDYYRKCARIVYHNPKMLLAIRNEDTSEIKEELQSFDNKLNELIGAMNILSQQVSYLVKNPEEPNNKADELLDEMIETILKFSDQGSLITKKEIESLYPAEFWKNFTDDVLIRLIDGKIIKALPGDRFEWL